MKITRDMLELVGKTPLLKLKRVTKGIGANIYVKCEQLNPSGSIKDRMALRMVNEAEKEGRLRPGSTIIEATSGNAGPALAFVGAMKGYRVRLLIPAQWTGAYSPSERIKIMNYFGAEVESFSLADYEEVLKCVSEDDRSAAIFVLEMKKCNDIEKSEPKIWWANQMCNPNNALAHRDTTGEEILQQTDGQVDAWVASIGSGGTLMGVAEALRKERPAARVVGVEPADACWTDWVRSGRKEAFFREFDIPKMKFLIETMLERGLPDEMMTVSDRDAREMAYRLCREEGIFCGMSSGANVYAAIQTAKKLGRDANIVTVAVDRRDRYFSENPNEHYVI